VGATAAAAQHEKGRVGLAARLRKSPKNATHKKCSIHALGDLHDQDSVVGSDGFDGMNDEGDSDCLGY
jgi:hypothetical protein